MAEEQTPEGVLDPSPAAPQPVAAPVPVSTAPWSQDISFVTDEAQRAQVDQYLREKWQPRMTQLEQRAAEAANLQRLHDDLTNNPAETMAALAAELNWQPEPFEAPPIEEAPVSQDLDPRIQALLDERAEQQANAAYEAEMHRIVDEHPGLDPEDMHAFVVSADGDFDQAYQLYTQRVERWNAKYAPESDPPPPVLGGDTGATTPATAPKAESFGDAFDRWYAGQAPTNDPPPVS